jgi:hypothetical protein
VNGGPGLRAGGPVPDGLPGLLFRGLYGGGYDLHTVNGVHVAVPKGTPVFAGATLSEVAWQISEHASGRDAR